MKKSSNSSIIQRIVSEKTNIDIPEFVKHHTMYETITGSESYGVSTGGSDVDVIGFCIPDREIIFPHLSGEIKGFGRQKQSFDQYIQHHFKFPFDPSREYDITIYNIVKYFHLIMENNPNMIDSLFTADNMILKRTPISQYLRSRRREFLHKGSWHKFKGYAYSQLHKVKIKKPDENSARYDLVQKHGYDVKSAYHVVRLLDEVKQILIEGDLDLQRNREQLKSIRRGEWSFQEIETYFKENEKYLEEIYLKSTLPHSPDEDKIKQILLDCLEMHFGKLDFLPLLKPERQNQALKEILEIVQRVL